MDNPVSARASVICAAVAVGPKVTRRKVPLAEGLVHTIDYFKTLP